MKVSPKSSSCCPSESCMPGTDELRTPRCTRVDRPGHFDSKAHQPTPGRRMRPRSRTLEDRLSNRQRNMTSTHFPQPTRARLLAASFAASVPAPRTHRLPPSSAPSLTHQSFHPAPFQVRGPERANSRFLRVPPPLLARHHMKQTRAGHVAFARPVWYQLGEARPCPRSSFQVAR